MTVYYNEIDPYAAEWLRNLIKAGHIPYGEVDTRSIVSVRPSDLVGFTQCHFFAGIGGWAYALRLAGWPDNRPIWTGSCPCQPFSVAGKGAGTDDPRHLWPDFFRLIRANRPPIVMGEQVARTAGYNWFDGVQTDLETENYASRAVDLSALAVNAPHLRQRLYWVAADLENASHYRTGSDVRSVTNGRRSTVDAGAESLRQTNGQSGTDRLDARSFGDGSFWSDAIWLTGSDGKARRSKPGLCLLANGIPHRMGKLRGYGNAIVPQIAAEVIKAFMETEPCFT